MQLDKTNYTGKNYFTGYGDQYILINKVRYEQALIVSPNRIDPWSVKNFDDLKANHFTILVRYAPEIVLFGSGAALRFVHPRLTSALTQTGIGFEVMDTQAACRTFNILNHSERNVLIALLPFA